MNNDLMFPSATTMRVRPGASFLHRRIALRPRNSGSSIKIMPSCGSFPEMYDATYSGS